MLNVKDDRLVVDEKGIYSIENFLHTRRLMYWQVYLHKTSVSAERLLVNLIRRAKYLAQSGEKLTCSDPLKIFLKQNYSIEDFKEKKSLLPTFGQLDDNDVWGAIKIWRTHRDPILSTLCEMMIKRDLFKIILSNDLISKAQIEKVRRGVCKEYNVLQKEATYLFSYGTVSNEAYVSESQTINILMRSGKMVDIAQASDLPTIKAISKIVKKNYLCWPKNISLP